MSKKDLVRRLLEEGDDFEGELDMDYTQTTLRKMKDSKEKLGGNKPKREKPLWKQVDDKDND